MASSQWCEIIEKTRSQKNIDCKWWISASIWLNNKRESKEDKMMKNESTTKKYRYVTMDDLSIKRYAYTYT